MKRKSNAKVFRILISLSACLVGLFFMFILDVCADSVHDEKVMEEIGQLVLKRAETMNDYYIGELEYIHAEEILRDFETGDLLEDDLENLKVWEHTDIDTVNDAEIVQVTLVEDNPDFLSASVIVSWNVSGLDGDAIFESTYETKCEKSGKTLKLSQFF